MEAMEAPDLTVGPARRKGSGRTGSRNHRQDRAFPLFAGARRPTGGHPRGDIQMAIIETLTRTVFALVSFLLMLLAAALVVYAGQQILDAILGGTVDARSVLLNGVGYTIIAVAIFDVAKYLLEEEVVRARELRHAGEARRSLTKFLSTITIVVFLEAIVAIFDAAKDGGPRMLYPVLLLLAGVALIIGFGLYLRLSAAAEQQIGGARGEAEDEADYEAAKDGKTPAKS